MSPEALNSIKLKGNAFFSKSAFQKLLEWSFLLPLLLPLNEGY